MKKVTILLAIILVVGCSSKPKISCQNNSGKIVQEYKGVGKWFALMDFCSEKRYNLMNWNSYQSFKANSCTNSYFILYDREDITLAHIPVNQCSTLVRR